MADRFGVQIGEAGIEFEILDPAIDFLTVHGKDGDRNARKTLVEWTGELRNDRQRGRNRPDPEAAGEALVDLVEFVAQILDFGENPMGVIKGHLSLGRQADIAMAALDDRRPEIVFEQPDRRR